MCTVSWLVARDGYELFCNRDERRGRPAALAPTVRQPADLRFVAPTDAEAGGTWIGVNELGLSFCLLNGRVRDLTSAAHEYTSRGLLLASLLSCRAPSDVLPAVVRAGLTQFRPFTILTLAPGHQPSAIVWTGADLTFEGSCHSRMPLTSSSFAPEQVAAARSGEFRAAAGEPRRPTADLLRRFHRSHSPARGPLSVCMHRPDASTVSFSHVKVSRRSVEFYYQPGPPCAGARAVRVSLPRTHGRETLLKAGHPDSPRGEAR